MKQKYNLTPEQQMRVHELRKMPSSTYDKICKKCGLCCLCKTGTEYLTFYTRMCCNYLDIKTKRCTIYNNRLKMPKYECSKVTPEIALVGNLVPRTCGYVEYIFGPAPTPIKFDWQTVSHCGNIDVSDLSNGVSHIIQDSINWKQR